MDNRPKTVFIDIDGTLIKHATPATSANIDYSPQILPV